MDNWKTGEYADPILPVGRATFEIVVVKMKETSGGTPFAQVTANISEFEGDYDSDDLSLLDPEGQTAWGTIWLPKPEDDPKKRLGKLRRLRKFLESCDPTGADLIVDSDDDGPVEVLVNSLEGLRGKFFKANIQHSEATEDYPSKAEINMMNVRRA